MSTRKSTATKAERTIAETTKQQMNDKASLVAAIVDLSLRAIAPDVSMEKLPNAFLLVQDSKAFRVGNLSAARISDLPAIPAIKWTGRYPLYMVSLVAPCLCLSLYGNPTKWVLTRVSFFCTEKSRRKLLDLERELAKQPGTYSHAMNEQSAPFCPSGSAFADDHASVPPMRRWQPLPPEHTQEAARWSYAQSHSDVVTLLGLEVRQVFRAGGSGPTGGIAPEIVVHKIL